MTRVSLSASSVVNVRRVAAYYVSTVTTNPMPARARATEARQSPSRIDWSRSGDADPQLLVQEPGRVDTGRSGHRVELLESVRGLKKITLWPPYSLTPRPSLGLPQTTLVDTTRCVAEASDRTAILPRSSNHLLRDGRPNGINRLVRQGVVLPQQV